MFGMRHTIVCLKISSQQQELGDVSGNSIPIESCGLESQGQKQARHRWPHNTCMLYRKKHE